MNADEEEDGEEGNRQDVKDAKKDDEQRITSESRRGI
jgi:hypothetical protein